MTAPALLVLFRRFLYNICSFLAENKKQTWKQYIDCRLECITRPPHKMDRKRYHMDSQERV